MKRELMAGLRLTGVQIISNVVHLLLVSIVGITLLLLFPNEAYAVPVVIFWGVFAVMSAIWLNGYFILLLGRWVLGGSDKRRGGRK